MWLKSTTAHARQGRLNFEICVDHDSINRTRILQRLNIAAVEFNLIILNLRGKFGLKSKQLESNQTAFLNMFAQAGKTEKAMMLAVRWNRKVDLYTFN